MTPAWNSTAVQLWMPSPSTVSIHIIQAVFGSVLLPSHDMNAVQMVTRRIYKLELPNMEKYGVAGLCVA